MRTNVGRVERIFRIILGVFILSLIFWGPESYWGILGIIPILTGLSGWCPLYRILGVSTHKPTSAKESPKV
jgi:hypothetical protein